MAAKSSPGGLVVATVTNPGSFMATITHPTGNGYCRDRILRDIPNLDATILVQILTPKSKLSIRNRKVSTCTLGCVQYNLAKSVWRS